MLRSLSKMRLSGDRGVRRRGAAAGLFPLFLFLFLFFLCLPDSGDSGTWYYSPCPITDIMIHSGQFSPKNNTGKFTKKIATVDKTLPTLEIKSAINKKKNPTAAPPMTLSASYNLTSVALMFRGIKDSE